ncbi:MAG: hypothetical protein IPM50_12290 [Acidobacteriota bacterium]|nr:MAG: hypothetical protein IPM50_12290 [Acidobacteriota bacterium]
MKYSYFFLLFSFLALSISAQVKYTSYVNDRFEFLVEYPSSLLSPQAPPANGDGRTFMSKDKKVEMRAWGENNALFRSIEVQFTEAKRQCGKTSYERVGAMLFAFSCVKNGRVIYQKTLYRESDDVYINFLIEYPLREKKRFDPIVTRIANSMRHDLNAG